MEIIDESEAAASVDSVWAEVATEDGQIYFHNTVTDETSWTRPGSAVEQALLTSYAQDEIDAWAREWSESGRTIPKGLKKACKQLKIKKGDLEEWLELTAGVSVGGVATRGDAI